MGEVIVPGGASASGCRRPRAPRPRRRPRPGAGGCTAYSTVVGDLLGHADPRVALADLDLGQAGAGQQLGQLLDIGGVDVDLGHASAYGPAAPPRRADRWTTGWRRAFAARRENAGGRRTGSPSGGVGTSVARRVVAAILTRPRSYARRHCSAATPARLCAPAARRALTLLRYSTAPDRRNAAAAATRRSGAHVDHEPALHRPFEEVGRQRRDLAQRDRPGHRARAGAGRGRGRGAPRPPGAARSGREAESMPIRRTPRRMNGNTVPLKRGAAGEAAGGDHAMVLHAP